MGACGGRSESLCNTEERESLQADFPSGAKVPGEGALQRGGGGAAGSLQGGRDGGSGVVAMAVAVEALEGLLCEGAPLLPE